VKGYDVIITGPAEEDLSGITCDIARKHLETPLAEKVISALGNIIGNLAETPFNHALVSDEKLVTTGIRRVMIHNYVVFYIASEKDKTVSVVRILNFHRYWENLL
jgi:toxin ParE1/3/4